VNDPELWHPSDGFDDDAIFADIIAHINDDEAESERTTQPPAEQTDGSNVHEATDKTTHEPTDHEASDLTDQETTDQETTDRAPGDHDQWPINQPPVLPTPGDPQAVPTPQVWRAHEVDDEYEEHFEPPPIKPLPVGDLQFWAIIAGMGGGPLMLLYLVFFNRDASSYWMLTAIAMSVGGFALLVSRLPRTHEDDDDDGARL